MPSEFDEAFVVSLDLRFAHDGRAATYTPPGGAPVAVTILPVETSARQTSTDESTPVNLRGREDRVRLSEMTPTIDGVLTVDGEAWTIVDIPYRGHGYARITSTRPERIEQAGRPRTGR
jgi:hypothetical protein